MNLFEFSFFFKNDFFEKHSWQTIQSIFCLELSVLSVRKHCILNDDIEQKQTLQKT